MLAWIVIAASSSDTAGGPAKPPEPSSRHGQLAAAAADGAISEAAGRVNPGALPGMSQADMLNKAPAPTSHHIADMPPVAPLNPRCRVASVGIAR